MRNLLRDVSEEELLSLGTFLKQHGITENAAASLSVSTGGFSAHTDSSFPVSDFRWVAGASASLPAFSGCSGGLWSVGQHNPHSQ